MAFTIKRDMETYVIEAVDSKTEVKIDLRGHQRPRRPVLFYSIRWNLEVARIMDGTLRNESFSIREPKGFG